jgi:HEAT repeat protein
MNLLRSKNGNDEISGLLNLFDSSDALLSEALIWSSVATGDIRFVPLLLESFADDRFSESAMQALNNFGLEGISNAAAQYPTANEYARSAICTLIGQNGDAGFSDLIGSALKDHSASVRRAATTAVAKLGMISSIPELLSLVDDADQAVSSTAVSSLQLFASIDRSGILNIARQFSASETPRHRRQASLLYASLGDHERLLLLAKDEDPLVRQAAVSAIGNLRLKSSNTILVMALVDENPDVRVAAADALGNIKDNSALKALEHALDDEDVWVRCAVLKAIAKIDRNLILTIIKRVYAAAEGLSMITCLQLLEADGGYDAQQIIRSSLTNPDPDIARQASISLQRFLSNF